ncbi:unnamed protein product, partial [marine sediment metagenome]
MVKCGLNTKRILLVEDEPPICDVCLGILAGEGFDVVVAANGKVAEDKLKAKDYDLLIIDLRTPVMDGKELYKLISRRYPELLNRIIFTTGDFIDAENQEFLELFA